MPITKKTSGYDTEERCQGIIDFLGEAIGKDHALVEDLSRCYAAQKQSHKQGDDYCRHYLMCDICNMNRFRLLKGIFYLAYRKGLGVAIP